MAGTDDIAVLDEDEESNKLPNTWPTEVALKSDSVNLLNLQDDDLIQFYKKTLYDDLCVYPMKHLIRGNVLIINNEHFLKLQSKVGTEHDRHKIEAVFIQLGFNVIVYNNLKTCEMEKTLLRESQADYSNHDCFILFILSHGDIGVVLGTDGDREAGSAKLSITHIQRLFSENKSLLGKPKLFFIQCCQGNKLDVGNALDDQPIKSSHLKVGAAVKQSEQTDSPYSDPVISNEKMSDDKETTNGPKISSEADIFLSKATVEGYVSWRDNKYGTWYIQAIGYIFRKFAYKDDLNKLMTMVNNLVSKSETKQNKFKQVATVHSTLTKYFYFFPCLHKPYVTLTEKFNQEKILRVSLEFELASQKGKYDEEKLQRQSLENDLRMHAQTIARLKKQVHSEKKKRKFAAEDEMKKRIDPICRQCKYSTNSARFAYLFFSDGWCVLG